MATAPATDDGAQGSCDIVDEDKDTSVPSDPSSQRLPRKLSVLEWISLSVLLAALAPILVLYFYWTARAGHYQYFPLLILGVTGLLWSRVGEAVSHADDPSETKVLIGWSIALLLALAGHLLASTFLGMLATMSALVATLYAALGWGGTRSLLPVISLLLLAVPLPLGWDRHLIYRLQFIASQFADLLLDGAGVHHTLEGVVLVTEKGRYAAEEACSGVRSLFSSLSVIAFYGVVARFRWQRIALNLIFAVAWVIIGNAIRVALSVYLADRIDPWYASGTGHEILSLLVFVGILAMIANTDAVFAQLLPDDWFDVDDVFSDGCTDREAAVPSNTREAVSMALGRFLTQTSPRLHPRSFLANKALLLGGLIVATVGTFALVHGKIIPKLRNSRDLAVPAASDLPSSIGPWHQVGFERVHRDVITRLAPESCLWTYQSSNLTAIISVDFPWNEWHNLEICYRALGWTVGAKHFLSTPEEAPNQDLTYSELALSKPAMDESGHVWFTVVDGQKHDVQPDDLRLRLSRFGPWATLQHQVRCSLGYGNRVSMVLPATTVQVLGESPKQMTREELLSLQNLFFQARSDLLDSPRWQ
ncbi:MAG: exosortase U [Planctomycetota bacterium]